VNLAVARVVLAGYLIWKTLPYDWMLYTTSPFVGFETYQFAVPPWPELLVVEKWLLVGLLLLFAVGYRVRVTALAAALLVGHFAIVRFTLNTSGGSTALFFSAWYLLFFALYAHAEDHDLSVDAVRRTGERSIDELRDFLKSDEPRTYAMHPLRWSLLAFALIYFGAGVAKLYRGGLAWFGPGNLSRNLLYYNEIAYHPLAVGSVLVDYPLVVTALAVGTVVFEVALLVVILLGLPIWPVVLGLFGMHAGVVLLMGMLFFDVVPMFAMFVAWDRLYARVVRSDELDVVYDEFCYFCARSLYVFKLLDINGTVGFYSQSDVPAVYRERDGTDGVDFNRAMYAFRDGVAYEGYDAFRQLLRQFTVFVPLAWVMGLGPVRMVGERVYREIAANRSQYFVCRIDAEGEGDDSGNAAGD
jgi:predicted DCC family thiol-disulfide oxidoreductase YuxK